MDGGFDGILRLQDGNPDRLLRHFGHEIEGRISPEQFQAFQTFHFRDVSQR
jgi:hypothetical protein